MKYAILKLPAVLCDKPNTLAALVRREVSLDRVAHVYLMRDFAFDGTPPVSFMLAASTQRFALHGTFTEAVDGGDFIKGFKVANRLPAGCIERPMVELKVQLDGPDVLLPETSDFGCVTGEFLMFAGDEVFSVCRSSLCGKGLYTITAARKFFATSATRHGAGEDAWFCYREKIPMVSHPFFEPGNVATFRASLGNIPVSPDSEIQVAI